jgi:chaperone required for assembly of F1-ATPase
MTARRRFYKTVTVSDDNAIALDGRPIKTPMKAPLRLPSRALAEAVAAEWEAQATEINPAAMPLTRLANTAIDRVSRERTKIEAEAVAYANSDLVCYRADRPPDLVARQAAAWDPVVDWARTALDAPFAVTYGVIHQPQPAAALTAFAAAAAALDDFELAAFHTVMTLTGSALIAMMLARRAISPEEAWRLAHVDEDYQIELWGEDDEAKARHAARREEFLASCRFLRLAGAAS